jgi:hypothetical protein
MRILRTAKRRLQTGLPLLLPMLAWLLSELANAGVMVTLGRAIAQLRSNQRTAAVPGLVSRQDLAAVSPALSSVSRRAA